MFLDYDSCILYLQDKLGCGESHTATAVCCPETAEAQAEAQEARSLVLDCTVETLIRLGEILDYHSTIDRSSLAPEEFQVILAVKVPQKTRAANDQC